MTETEIRRSRYRLFSEEEPILVFSQSWWLDAVWGVIHLDVIIPVILLIIT